MTIKKTLLTLCLISFKLCNSTETIEKKNAFHNKKSRMDFFLNHALNFMFSRALYVAAQLNIADILHQQPCTLAELATKTITHKSSLGRLLHLLQLQEVFTCDETGMYHNTALSTYMTADHPETVRPLLLHEDATRWNCLGNLDYSITTGSPVFDHLYGMPYFDYTSQDPLLNQRFNEAMTTISQFEEKSISTCYPFNNYSVIADIGGGRGGMLKNILKNHTSPQAILADLPEAISDHQLLTEFPGRLSVQAVNFFEPIAVRADLYILKRILHDWSDEQAAQILKNIATAMPPQSRLLIIEALVDDEGAQAYLIAQIDLLLLAVFGGRERTKAEFKNLIDAAGLTILDIHKTDSLVSLIECSRSGE